MILGVVKVRTLEQAVDAIIDPLIKPTPAQVMAARRRRLRAEAEAGKVKREVRFRASLGSVLTYSSEADR